MPPFATPDFESATCATPVLVKKMTNFIEKNEQKRSEPGGPNGFLTFFYCIATCVKFRFNVNQKRFFYCIATCVKFHFNLGLQNPDPSHHIDKSRGKSEIPRQINQNPTANSPSHGKVLRQSEIL